jgi:Tripartite tricarboxylate transporter family receptor
MNHFPRRQFLHLAAGAAALPALARMAWAQAYPSRPVRIIVGFPPAGGNDLYARLIAQWLSERLGAQFIVENRPGAGGNLGTEAAAKAPSDGYTLLLAWAGDTWNATLYSNLKFNFIRDIEPVATISRGTGVLVVHPSVRLMSVPDHRICENQSGQTYRGVSRYRHQPTYVVGAVQEPDRGRHAARALSRGGACLNRLARWTGPVDVRGHGSVDRIHPGRQAARNCGDRRDTCKRLAGYSNRGRVRARLRGEHLVGYRRSQEYARRNR